VEEKLNERNIKLKGYLAGERYYLATTFRRNPQPTGVICGKSYWFDSKEEYLEKLHT